MAKLNDSNLGGASGRVGRLVVTNISGYGFVKHRPAKRGSHGASAKQLLIQMRMTMAGNFIANYKNLACHYYGKRRGLKSPYNQAMKNIMDHFVLNYDTNSIVPNYHEIGITKGNLLGIYGPSVAVANPYEVTLSWMNTGNVPADRGADLLQVVMSVDQSFATYYVENAAERQDLTVTVVTPPEFSGKQVHVWMAFVDPVQKIACNSVYMGEVAVL